MTGLRTIAAVFVSVAALAGCMGLAPSPLDPAPAAVDAAEPTQRVPPVIVFEETPEPSEATASDDAEQSPADEGRGGDGGAGGEGCDGTVEVNAGSGNCEDGDGGDNGDP